MKCPKCRSEVGNQSICPYCGATVYINGNNWNNPEYSRHSMTQVRDVRSYSTDGKDVESRIRNLETRINILLVFQCGVFVLNVLVLLILAVK